MKYFNLLLAVGLFVLLATSCGSPKPKPATPMMEPEAQVSSSQVDSIQHYLSDFPNKTQVAVAILRGDSVRYIGAKRHQDTLKNIQNRDSVFEIGSITKVFTSTLLAHAMIEQKARLDDPVAGFYTFDFHEAEKDGKVITLQSLANHTSGLPRLPSNMMFDAVMNSDNPYKDYDQGKLEDYLKNDLTLNAVPGETYAYSNLGAGLLGNALEQAFQTSYERLLQAKVFQPLGMEHSTTYREDVQDRLVGGLDPEGKPTPNWDLNALKAAGAILSSVADLSQFAKANFHRDSLGVYELLQQKTFTVNDNMALALGWHILTTRDGYTWHWHNGGTGGYSSSMALDLERQHAVIVLSNVSAFHDANDRIDQLTFSLMRTLVNEP